jgi:hypothetical protein
MRGYWEYVLPVSLLQALIIQVRYGLRLEYWVMRYSLLAPPSRALAFSLSGCPLPLSILLASPTLSLHLCPTPLKVVTHFPFVSP